MTGRVAARHEGRDLQLEKTVEIALQELHTNSPKPPKLPPFPNYHQKLGQ